MRPETILGFDPAPGRIAGLVAVSDVLRRSIRGLVDARAGLDRLGRTGSVWDGPSGAPIATLLRHYTRQLSVLEEALLDCMQAVDQWRDGVEQRQAQVADIVAAVAETSGEPEAQDRRTRLLSSAREIGAEHERAARDLAGVFEDLSTTVAELEAGADDFAAELDHALLALTAAVEDWIDAEGPELIRTAIALGEVAGLTTVISELVGIAALGRNPEEAEGVSAIVARSPGSHRLIRALRRQWQEVAPTSLPPASFAIRPRPALDSLLEGRTQAGGDAGGSGE
jgi:ABC-type transporter Mla subunit MlaD